MLNDASGQQIKNTQSVPVSDLLTLAAWCGLVAGLLEGVWLYLSHGRGWLNPEILFGVSLEIIWISAVVNLLVFLLLILLVRLSIARFPRLPAIRVYLFVCLSCATADWAGSSGRISSLGIVVFSAGLAIFLSGKLQSHSQQIFRSCRRSLPAVMGVSLVAFIVI